MVVERNAFVPGQFRQAGDVGAQRNAHTVVLVFEFVHRIDFAHPGHEDAAGVNAELGEVGNIDLMALGVQRGHRPVVILFGGGAEVPVGKVEVGRTAQKLPRQHAAGIDEVDFQVLRIGDLVTVEAGSGKSGQRVERAALQQFGEGAFQRDLEMRVRAKAGEAALIAGVQQGDVHHRVAPAERSVFHQDAETRLAQAADADGNVRVARDHVLGHVRQAQRFADDAELHMALENFRQRLGARFHQRVTGRHAVAHIQIADEVDRKVGGRAVGQALIGQRANAACLVAGVEVDELRGRHRFVRVVEGAQLGVEQPLGPGVAVQREPALTRRMHMRTVGYCLAQVEMRPEIMGGQTLGKLAQRASPRRQLRGALAVGEQQCAVVIAHMHRPHTFHRVEPGALFEVKAQLPEPAAQHGDGLFERSVLAGNEMFGGGHGRGRWKRALSIEPAPAAPRRSEDVNEPGVAEQRAQTPPVKAQSTAVPVGTARICNAERGCLGARSGHGGFVHTLSTLGVWLGVAGGDGVRRHSATVIFARRIGTVGFIGLALQFFLLFALFGEFFLTLFVGVIWLDQWGVLVNGERGLAATEDFGARSGNVTCYRRSRPGLAASSTLRVETVLRGQFHDALQLGITNADVAQRLRSARDVIESGAVAATAGAQNVEQLRVV